MAYDKSIFENLRKDEMSYIKLDDESHVPVIGKGDVKMEALVNGKWKPCTLTNVLCVPNLRTNLFSFSQRTDRGYRFESRKTEMKVIKDGKIHAIAERRKNLYVMKFRKCSAAEASRRENR